MLKILDIENIAVIEKAQIEFNNGLNVLTGETGAGKSIIVDSINAILGERTSRELVRHGAQYAFVSALFEQISPEAEQKLRELGYEPETDGTLLLTRKISDSGKSVCRIRLSRNCFRFARIGSAACEYPRSARQPAPFKSRLSL